MPHSVLLLARFLARKIRGVVAAPFAGEMRHVGIGTERARPRYLVGFDARSEDRVRRFAGFDPVNEGCEGIEVVDTDAASAMEHSWHHDRRKKSGVCGPLAFTARS